MNSSAIQGQRTHLTFKQYMIEVEVSATCRQLYKSLTNHNEYWVWASGSCHVYYSIYKCANSKEGN